MPEFRYIGYDSRGRRVKGVMIAPSQEAAIQKIKQRDVYPEEIRPVRVPKGGLLRRKGLDNLALFSRHLSVLLASGVTLSEALDSISEEFRGQWRRLTNRVSERVQEGASLATALREMEGVFPEYYCHMVEAAEESGNLPDVLRMLSEYIDIERTIDSKVSTSLIYPSFMIVVAVFVLSFVFTFVLPRVTRVFEASRVSLPTVTVILIRVSHFLYQYWWVLFLSLAVVIYLLWRLHRAYPWVIEGILLKVPLLRALYLSRFTATLGFLLKAGVPITKAMKLASQSTGNSQIKRNMERSTQMITEGAPLSQSLQDIPPVLRQMIATGEKTGQLSSLLIKASEAYREELFRSTERLLSIIEPLMVLLMGAVVGLIVFGVLMPIFQLNQIIR